MDKVIFFVPFGILFNIFSDSDHSDGFYGGYNDVRRCFCKLFGCSSRIGDDYFTCDEETFTVIILTLGSNTGIRRLSNEEI